MSKAPGTRDLSETFLDALTALARWLFGLGALALIIGLGFLLFLCFRVAGDASLATDAMKNIDMFERVYIAGTIAVVISVSFLFWGDDLPSGIMVLLSGALYFAPSFLPSIIGNGTDNAAVGAAFGAIQMGGTIMGVLSIGVLATEIGIRVRERAKIGVKADHLKYGKGIKEEKDRQNVFMGSCWQLPYCRKFVRERCPIFHAKRTCWREKVGCMCEEQVIRDAMENKPIPKDVVLAGKMIPKNFRLSEPQKIERCKNCVIYNEHQRHKYKAWLYLIVASFIVVPGLLWSPMMAATEGVVGRVNDAVHKAAMTQSGGHLDAPTVFVGLLLFVFILVALAYSLKLLEYLIFKLKI